MHQISTGTQHMRTGSRPEGGYFTAIAIGVSRTDPMVVSGLRFDIVGADQQDEQRQTLLVGEGVNFQLPN